MAPKVLLGHMASGGGACGEESQSPAVAWLGRAGVTSTPAILRRILIWEIILVGYGHWGKAEG